MHSADDQKLREEVVVYVEPRGYVAPSLVKSQRLGRTESRKRWCKVSRTSERAEDRRSVLGLRENRSSIEGLLGKATAARQSGSPGKGTDVKGKSGKGGGKKRKSKDARALVWEAALDLRATTMAQQEVANPRWKAFNVDTGAGGTVWPMNADYACEKVSGPAAGEMVEGQGRFRVRRQSVWGHQLHMTGEKTSVHKPLLSAGDVTDKGRALWMDMVVTSSRKIHRF